MCSREWATALNASGSSRKMRTERCPLGLVTWNSLLNFDEFEWRGGERNQVNKGILCV